MEIWWVLVVFSVFLLCPSQDRGLTLLGTAFTSGETWKRGRWELSPLAPGFSR